ncbi:tetraacyldisaccharide 4'-kinase [Halomonas sediminis]
MNLAERWLQAAYQGSRWLVALRPLAAVYRQIIARRAQAYAVGRKPIWRAPVPVIVVGNITLGGTGKSPLVAWLGRWLTEQGYKPGIVSRGYGGKAPTYPLEVIPDTCVSHSGDEPLMLAQQTGLPVVVDPQRARGAEYLVEAGCTIIISDDGLQHLALGRDIELVVIDGARGLGNGQCLPAGPLREPVTRLAGVDKVIINGNQGEAGRSKIDNALEASAQPVTMSLAPSAWRRLSDGRRLPLSPLPFELPVYGLAGIGNPQRFFSTLEALGIEGSWHPLGDHHRFSAADFDFGEPRPVVITAKDAVKCHDVAGSETWVLEVEAVLPADFEHWLAARLLSIT